MKDLLHYILSHIVTVVEDIEISEEQNEYGSIILTVKVNKEDMGRVIGKDGKIIRAIRDVVKILAVKENKHVDVVLAE